LKSINDKHDASTDDDEEEEEEDVFDLGVVGVVGGEVAPPAAGLVEVFVVF